PAECTNAAQSTPGATRGRRARGLRTGVSPAASEVMDLEPDLSMPPSFPVLSRASLLPVLAIALGGCAAGSTSATLPGGPGAITLTSAGLARGAARRIGISARNGDREPVATSRALDSLALGVYRLTPLASQAMNHTWGPTEGPRTLGL